MKYEKEHQLLSSVVPQWHYRIARPCKQLHESGITPEKFSYVEEKVYCSKDIIKEIQVDGKTYRMKVFTEEDLGIEETTAETVAETEE